MEDCVFCKIVKGEIPCFKVYEDKNFLGFLDINSLNPGHSLLVPKLHYRWADDVPNFGQYFETAKKIALAIRKVYQPIAIYYLTFGFGVPHAHIHIIPRFENDGHQGEIPTKKTQLPPEKMQEIAEKIIQNI